MSADRPDNIDDFAKKQHTASVNHVAMRMKLYHHGDPVKVQHFVRVYTLAKTIGELEHLSEEEQLDLELAAVVHNVEEEERVPVVRDMLRACGINEAINMRVCHMVANQYNYEHIGTLDHQILTEAMLIVDFKEQRTPEDEIVRIAEKRFITNSGKLFLKRAFNV